MISNRVVRIVAIGRKKIGGVLVSTLLLVLITSWATGIIKVVIISRNRVLNFKKVEDSQFFHAFLIGSVVVLIKVIAIKEVTNASSVARKAIGSRIF